MFCSNCNKKIPDDSVFCILCGAEIKTELQESTNLKVIKVGFYDNNKSLKFDLNIEKILEDWEVYDAIREIIANALDEQLLTNTKDILCKC